MTIVSNAKIGDKLRDDEPSPYGQYINMTVRSIRITKSGRYVIEIGGEYKKTDGTVIVAQPRKYSNGAIAANALIDIID